MSVSEIYEYEWRRWKGIKKVDLKRFVSEWKNGCEDIYINNCRKIVNVRDLSSLNLDI